MTLQALYLKPVLSIMAVITKLLTWPYYCLNSILSLISKCAIDRLAKPPRTQGIGCSCYSVYLRPGSDCQARARLTATYRSCCGQLNTCIVTSYRIPLIQATAAWPHSCSLELNTSSKIRPGLLQLIFRRSDNVNMNAGMDVEDLSEG